MEATLKAVYMALQTAPLIAMLLILPHTVIGYVRQKSVNVRRSTYLYVFVLYFLCAYFMTMLSLPSADFFKEPVPLWEHLQLIPFHCFFETNLLRSPVALAIVVFNALLTAPLGFFLRFLFGFKLKKTLLVGFLTSLLYEVTQITGLFFIYPAPYRIFDVDDLIVNTLGALVGYLLFPLLTRVLPPIRDRGNRLVQGSEVSFLQRCAASAIDLALVLGLLLGVAYAVPPLKALLLQSGSLWRFPAFYLLFLLLGALYAALLSSGTLGMRIAGLRLRARGGRGASRLRGVARFTALNASVVAIPFWVYFFMNVNEEYAGAESIVWVLLGALLMMCAAAVLLEMMFNAVTHGSSMFYDRLVKTYVAYGNSRKTSLFGIRVIDVRPLDRPNVDALSEQVCKALLSMGVEQSAVTRVRLMAEGVMLDWIEGGLGDTPCELRLDQRYRRRTLMLSVSGEDRTRIGVNDGYAEMLEGLDLTLDTYYAAEKNVCNILIPQKT